MTGLVDTTLREGAQAPGAYLSSQHRAELLAALVRIGVEEVELGHAVAETAYGDGGLPELLAQAATLAPGLRRAAPAVTTWTRQRRWGRTSSPSPFPCPTIIWSGGWADPRRGRWCRSVSSWPGRAYVVSGTSR